jgi:hypothetical protein
LTPREVATKVKRFHGFHVCLPLTKYCELAD